MRAWAYSSCSLLFYIYIMVVIEQLRISPDCQKLFIDAHINKAPYFNNVGLSSISIDTQDTVLQTFDGPSENTVFTYTNTPSSHIVKTNNSPTVLTGNSFINALDGDSGALILDIATDIEANETYVTLGFRGEYIAPNKGLLALKITAIGSDESSHYVLGTLIDKKQHLWEFKNKFAIGKYSSYSITLVEMQESEEIASIPFTSTQNINTLNFIYDTYTEYLIQDLKEVHLVVDKNEINADLSKDMLYVYFHTTGTPSLDTPCRLDEVYTLGVTFNEGVIYNRMMNYTKEIIDTCSMPNEFINIILQLEAIKAAIETENYASANKFYNKLINAKSSIGTSNINCRCYG